MMDVCRIRSFDSIRGIAALVVVTCHLALVGDGWSDPNRWWIKWTPLRAINLAHEAVILFFVLSGFVLSLSLQREKQSYQQFILRRFCRIYLPFAAAIFASVALKTIFDGGPVEGASFWIPMNWTSASPGTIAGHLVMTGFQHHVTLDGVMWSLVHEMRVSLIFPFLFAASHYRPVSTSLVVSLISASAFICMTALGQSQFIWAESAVSSLLLTAFYLFAFQVGLMVALYRKRWVAFVADHARACVVLTAACFLAVCELTTSAGVADWPIAIVAGALLVIVLAVDPVQKALDHRVLQWLGKVSYSLYLLHVPVILAVVHTFGPTLGLAASVICSLPAALVAAHWFNLTVEKAAARLGLALTTPISVAQRSPT